MPDVARIIEDIKRKNFFMTYVIEKMRVPKISELKLTSK
jgi:hypothetical protein